MRCSLLSCVFGTGSVSDLPLLKQPPFFPQALTTLEPRLIHSVVVSHSDSTGLTVAQGGGLPVSIRMSALS